MFKKPHFHDRLNTNRLENHGLSSTNRAHPLPQVIKFRTLILNYLNNWGQGIKFSLTPGRDSRSKKKKQRGVGGQSMQVASNPISFLNQSYCQPEKKGQQSWPRDEVMPTPPTSLTLNWRVLPKMLFLLLSAEPSSSSNFERTLDAFFTRNPD